MITNLRPRVSSALLPKGSQIVDLMATGLKPLASIPGQGAQIYSAPLLSHAVGAAHGADCPTCDLVEIPYNPNLPVLNFTG